ncbi:hypothetical protein NT6N_36200 [Oceaniferula spumae]|uniref:EF-hand domain-containing protein n=1 Tax=Oceaniferula spumae TaxID=2979115 RepID=A0AAT9FRD7_9BACT
MKSNTKTAIQILLVSVFGASLALAQGPGGRPPHGPPHGPPPGGGNGGPEGDGPPPPPIMEALDKDEDGSISKDELAAAAEALKSLDANKDGKLTADELAPEKPAGAKDDEKRGRRKPHVPPIMKALDTDENGEISAEELEGAAKALQELDSNNDGELSKMETRPNRRFKKK